MSEEQNQVTPFAELEQQAKAMCEEIHRKAKAHGIKEEEVFRCLYEEMPGICARMKEKFKFQ